MGSLSWLVRMDVISRAWCHLAWKSTCFSSLTSMDRGKPSVSGVSESGPAQAVDSLMVYDT